MALKTLTFSSFALLALLARDSLQLFSFRPVPALDACTRNQEACLGKIRKLRAA
jgi:hypothetical protein